MSEKEKPIWKNFSADRYRSHVLMNPDTFDVPDVPEGAIEKWEALVGGEPWPYPRPAPALDEAPDEAPEPAGIPDDLFEDALDRFKGRWIRPGVSKGMLEKRVGSIKPIYLNPIGLEINRSVNPDLAAAAPPEVEEKRPDDETPPVLMTEQQRMIHQLVQTAAKEGPALEDVQELFTQLQMQIPKLIKKSRPEFAYRWTAVEELQKALVQFGGLMELVTRTNHPHLPDVLFGTEGGIVYKGQNILTFTRREISDAFEKKTIKDFDLKVDASVKNLEKRYSAGGKDDAVVVEIQDGEEQLPEISSQALATSAEYDYGDTPDPAGG